MHRKGDVPITKVVGLIVGFLILLIAILAVYLGSSKAGNAGIPVLSELGAIGKCWTENGLWSIVSSC